MRFFTLWHPELLAVVGLFFVLYYYVTSRANTNASNGTTMQHWTALGLCLLVFYVAMGSPIDDVAQNQSLSVFAIQTLLMTFVAPWLLLVAIPTWILSTLLQIRWIYHTMRILTKPVVALLAYNALAAIYLIPCVFNANLTDNWLHMIDEWILMATAVFLWWPIVNPSQELPRLNRGAQLVYILFGMNFMMPIPFFMIASHQLWYHAYLATGTGNAQHFLTDQHIAGIIMLVGMAMIFGVRAIMTVRSYSTNPLHS